MWMYKKDPDRSRAAPGLRNNNGEGNFWAYREKILNADWCSALQWVGNTLRHAGGRTRLWELDGKGHPVWGASSDFPTGSPSHASMPHSIKDKKFYDVNFHNVASGDKAHVQQSLNLGAQFLKAAAPDLLLPMTKTEIWPKENCPYDIEIP